jgi:hypothetical protein
MVHAKSLRVIGQSLEAARVEAFELEKHDEYYVVWSNCLTEAGEWILKNALSNGDLFAQRRRESTGNRTFCFRPADITRLDAQSQKKRTNHSSAHMQASKLLSQRLRTLGDHLDRTEVHTFHISWTPDCVSIDYQGPDGQRDRRTFTAEKLQQLSLHTRFRRSNRHVLAPKI